MFIPCTWTTECRMVVLTNRIANLAGNQGGQVWAKKTVMRMALSSADWMEWCKWASGRAIYSRGRTCSTRHLPPSHAPNRQQPEIPPNPKTWKLPNWYHLSTWLASFPVVIFPIFPLKRLRSLQLHHPFPRSSAPRLGYAATSAHRGAPGPASAHATSKPCGAMLQPPGNDPTWQRHWPSCSWKPPYPWNNAKFQGPSTRRNKDKRNPVETHW